MAIAIPPTAPQTPAAEPAPPRLLDQLRQIAHSEEPFLLLGRDLLNDRQLFLDGPGLALEIA